MIVHALEIFAAALVVLCVLARAAGTACRPTLWLPRPPDGDFKITRDRSRGSDG